MEIYDISYICFFKSALFLKCHNLIVVFVICLITKASSEEARQDHVILDGPFSFNTNCHSKIGNLF